MATSDPTASKVPDSEDPEVADVGDMTKSDKMVKIYVGPEKECWVIHEDLICNKSKYFRSAFQGGFAESTKKSIILEDENPKSFKLFVEWLYNGPIDREVYYGDGGQLHLLQWYGLSAMADKFGLKALGAAVEGAYVRCTYYTPLEDSLPIIEEIKFVYSRSTADVPGHLSL